MALPKQNSHIVLFLWFSVQFKSTLHTYMHTCLWINWNFESLTCIVPKYPIVLKVPNIFSLLNKKQKEVKRDWSFRYLCVYFILCAYLNFREVFCALCCGLFGTRQDWHWSRLLFATPTVPCILYLSNNCSITMSPVMAKYPLERKQNLIWELAAENHQVWLKHLVTPIYT